MDVILLNDVYHGGWIRGAGAYRLATELRDANISTQVIDFICRLTYEEVVKVFDKFITKETKILGISNTFLSQSDNKIFPQKWMMSLIREYKERYGFKVVIGGNRLGIDHYKNTLDNTIDLIVLGFADKAIIEIVNNFANIRTTKLNDIKLLDCKDQSHVYKNFQKSQIKWHNNDSILKNEFLPIETARGCVFRCSYCFFPGNGKRYSNDHVKNKDVLIEELIKNYEQYGTTTYDIMDDLLNDSPEKCEFIHDVFTNLPFKIKYVAYARADLLISHPHTLDLLKDSGCMSLQFGIETLNKESGKTIGKSMDRNKMIEGLHRIKQNAPDITIGSGFIVGLPYETKEMLEQTMSWLESKDCPLDNKEIYPLSLPKTSSRFEKSKMMINPELYGYKNIDDAHKEKIVWDNGNMNYNEATKIAENFKDRLRDKNVLNSHQLIRVMNLDVSRSVALSMTRDEVVEKLEVGVHDRRVLNKKQEYLEKLYAL